MGLARRVQSELALAGGREGSLRGAAANPRILSRIPRMRLRSFAFPSVTMGRGGFGVSFSPVPIVRRVFTV